MSQDGLIVYCAVKEAKLAFSSGNTPTNVREFVKGLIRDPYNSERVRIVRAEWGMNAGRERARKAALEEAARAEKKAASDVER